MINMKEDVNTSTVVTKELLTKKIWLILILRLNKSNQWVGVDHATQIHSLSTPPMTSSADENKMEVMMTLTI